MRIAIVLCLGVTLSPAVWAQSGGTGTTAFTGMTGTTGITGFTGDTSVDTGMDTDTDTDADTDTDTDADTDTAADTDTSTDTASLFGDTSIPFSGNTAAELANEPGGNALDCGCQAAPPTGAAWLSILARRR